MTREGLVQTFDEKAALAELERLRDSIEAARQARRRTSDEFEAFVKSFRKPAATPMSESQIATPDAPEVLPQAVAESISRPPQTPDPLSSAGAVLPNTEEADVSRATPLVPSPRRYRLNMQVLGALAVIAVIALGVWSTRSPKPTSPPARANSVSGDLASTRTSKAPPAAAPALTPQKPAASAVVLELRPIRPVWMRIVVDGRKDVEGMVPTGEPLHLAGDSTIVVRVGNGGDVLVKTGSREEPFGVAGQPLTRTFSHTNTAR